MESEFAPRAYPHRARPKVRASYDGPGVRSSGIGLRRSRSIPRLRGVGRKDAVAPRLGAGTATGGALRSARAPSANVRGSTRPSSAGAPRGARAAHIRRPCQPRARLTHWKRAAVDQKHGGICVVQCTRFFSDVGAGKDGSERVLEEVGEPVVHVLEPAPRVSLCPHTCATRTHAALFSALLRSARAAAKPWNMFV
jgi:hypothetical protein